MNYPKHNRENFFKYTSAEAAIKILESSSVIYRSPLQFNDPFDIQSGLHFDFDIESLPDIIWNEIERLVEQDKAPGVSTTGPFGILVHNIWAMKQAHSFPKEDLKTVTRPPLIKLKNVAITTQQQYQKHWWENFLPRLRVFCVSETKDNLLMWSHYSKDHTGVVLEFRVLPEQDNALCAAEPIRYTGSPPPFFTKREWLDEIFDVHPLNEQALYFRYAYVKSDVWSYEREWRVWDLLPKALPDLSSKYSLHQNETAAIYLGCKIEASKRETILALLSRHPACKPFQARKAADEFRLDFDPI